MKINFYISLLYYVILFNIMNHMFNYYYLIFTAYLLWVFSVATTFKILKKSPFPFSITSRIMPKGAFLQKIKKRMLETFLLFKILKKLQFNYLKRSCLKILS